MPDSIEFLNVVHHLQIATRSGIDALNMLIDTSIDGTVTVNVESMKSLITVLEVEHTLVAKLVEENQMIKDMLDDMANGFKK